MCDDPTVQQSNKRAQSAQAHRCTWSSQTTILCLLLFVLLVSFGLRVYRLGDKSVWWDEGLAAWSARQSLVEIAQWTSSDVHPPLYFWMLHFWRWGSGDSEFGLRLLSAAIGVLTVAATFRLSRTVGGPKTGLLAGLLVGISRFDIWWSQEMRMYGLAALWATLSLWAAIRFWDRDRLTDGVLYVVFATAGMYTLYLSVSVILVANLVWLWILWRAKQRGRALLRWGVAQAGVLVLCVPWLAYALSRIPTWSSASPVTLDVFLQIYWTVLTTGIPVSVESYRWLTIPALVIFLVGLLALLWQSRGDWRVGRNAAILLASLLLPAGIVYVVSLPRETFFYSPQLAPRYLLIFAPAFYTLQAWGLTFLEKSQRWPVGKLLVAAVVGIAIYGLCQYYPGRVLQDDYKALTATLHAYQRSDDAVVLYTDTDWPIFAYHHPDRWWGVPHAQPMTSQTASAYLSPIWASHEGIWLVVTPYAGINDPNGEMPAWLAERAAHTVEHHFADKVLRFYARTEERAHTACELTPDVRPPHAVEADVGAGRWLAGYELPVREYQSGDAIHLFLYWEGKDFGDQAPLNLEVSLVNKHGQVWKHTQVAVPDVQAGENPVRQQVDFIVPPDAPGGRYAFTVGPLPDGKVFHFGRVLLRQRQHARLTATDVTITHPLETNFDDGVRLLGYDLEAEGLRSGGVVYLTLYWQAREPVEHRYKVFTHLLGEVFNAGSGNFLWGQQDSEPVNGTWATSTWRPGEIVVDSYAIPLDPQAPAGRYAIEIGLYDPATGDRLFVLDNQGQAVADHLVLAHVTTESE